MPTIEIICVAQTEPLDFSNLPFAVRAENKLLSHRGLFQSDFDKLQGCIYHLGNPDMRGDDDFGFFAYELINDAIRDEDNNVSLKFDAESGEPGVFWFANNSSSPEDCLKFDDEFVPYVKTMLEQLLIASPVDRITFSSDWQFGTEDVQKFKGILEQKFWDIHDACKLRFNTFYEIVM